MAGLIVQQNDLSSEEVERLIYSYEGIGVTDELVSFGQTLVAEVQQRSGQIDSKAAMVLGWSTAVLAFLFSSLRGASVTPSLGFSVIGALCALFAALQAYRALRARQGWESPSDADWFEKSALINADELKRFHIRCWHGVRQSQNALAEQKGKLLLSAQRLLVLAAAFLAAGLIVQVRDLFFHVCVPTLTALNNDVWAGFSIARGMLLRLF